ncbi:unnamed protein product [Linum trigynum]|uniref:Uncharacterized protein n=1 Tax=Linum trigynum TaxID=586398 RepID=A0AAV2D5A1_9ROSI
MECESLVALLIQYEMLSGQKVNLAKSALCFSRDILLPDAEVLGWILGVGSVIVTDQYLGLPSLVGRSKMETFRCFEERVLSRLQGWK